MAGLRVAKKTDWGTFLSSSQAGKKLKRHAKHKRHGAAGSSSRLSPAKTRPPHSYR